MEFIKIKNQLEHSWYKRVGYPVVQIGSATAPRRALLAYLSQGVKWKENDRRFGWHQNYRQSREIAFLLADRGYRVDVAQYNDEHFIPSDPYDLIIAHPGIVSKRLQALPKTGVRLCLRTGRHAAFVDRVITERYALLEKRRGQKIQWAGTGETDQVYLGYDAIACFDGNGMSAETFTGTGLPVYSFRNYANPAVQPVEKDWQIARAGFIYMAGHLHISKGLDWLIEAFADRTDRHLYICGKIPPELENIYAGELKKPNLHPMGFTQLNSAAFRHICTQAAWYISPSATDGCQGTALDAMASGLVPILSPACGVDACGAGLRLNPCTPDVLRIALEQAIQIDAGELQQQSELSRNVVESRYRPEHFLEDWRGIIDRIEGSRTK